MSHRPFNVLFVCSGNSARSIMAEGILNQIGAGRFVAYSAGSAPRGDVDPNAMRVLADLNMPTERARCKSWAEFATPGAVDLDFVFTVCDVAAGETCPAWPGRPLVAHWAVEDPVPVTGTPEEVLRKFKDVAVILRRRIELFISLPVETLNMLSLKREVEAIGER
jgi:arsenate reductase